VLLDPTERCIASLHPDVGRAAFLMVYVLRSAGIPMTLISCARTPSENIAAGGSELSYHLTGLAFDVAVHGYTRDQIPFAWWAMLGDWAENNLGLSWGGRFVHAGQPDVNHFDARRWFTSA